MPAQHTPRVIVPEDAPRKSRPLRTGKRFYLVVAPPQQFIKRDWDKVDYDPGEQAELRILGKHLGTEKLELTIERDDGENGEENWHEVARVQAQPNSDGTEAKAQWTMPELSPLDGRLVEITCDPAEANAGETLSARLTTEGLEGAGVEWSVEAEQPDGTWRTLTVWAGTVQDHAADATYQLPAHAGEAGAVGALQTGVFEDDALSVGDTAWLKAQTQGLEGAWLTFFLEREREGGGWEPVGQATATVRAGGEARVGITLDNGGAQ